MFRLNISGLIPGLTKEENAEVHELVDVYNYHQIANQKKRRYYEGHISLGEVNLGIALPKSLKGFEIGCEWGAKTVDVLASRSMFDGFVGISGDSASIASQIVDDNDLVSQYMKAVKDELKYGCTFATLSGSDNGCSIRFHSPETASALWDGQSGRIKSGLVIIDTVQDESEKSVWYPSVLNYYTDDAVIVLMRTSAGWKAERHPHKMGRPLMEPLVWNPTSSKPFGRSRIKAPIRHLIEGYVRTIANATIGLEFATSPQKYLLGVTDDQYDAIISDKFKQYVGSILAATTNPETGANPTVGQFQQGNIEPHVQMIRILATQFSAATGLSMTDTGIINDANPTSSDAILAQSQTLVSLAEQLNEGNSHSLRMILMMAEAIARDVTIGDLTGDERGIIAHFKNPAMPSVAVTADAAIKIASVRQGFADTDTFLEMIGFGQADIRRIKAQESRIRGQMVLDEVMADADQA